MSTWVPWSPHWAKHVRGQYTVERFKVADGKQVKHMRAVCIFKLPDGSHCNQSWQGVCDCNNVKARISRFARGHMHRGINDNVPRVVAKGSLRR